MTTSAASASMEQTLNKVLEYVRAVVRYRWQVLLAALSLTLAAAVLIARLPNVYQATTTILVDPQSIPEKYVSSAVNSDPNDRLNTITQQVLSRSRLEEVINKFDLYRDLRTTAAPEDVIEQMRRKITIQVKQGSGQETGTFAITFEGERPVLVAQVADELATSFIRWNVQDRDDKVRNTKEFLTTELQQAKRNLEEQEDKLRQFKMGHLGETPDQTGNNLQAASGLRATFQANQERMNRLDQERMLLTRLPEPVTGGNVATLSPRARLEMEKRQLETTLAGLRQQYTEDHPDTAKVIRQLAEVNSELKALPPDAVARAGTAPSDTQVRVEVLDKEMRRLRAEQAHLQAQIELYQSKIDIAPMREQQLVELTRNYDQSSQHYQGILNKSLDLAMASDLELRQKGERFRLLDAARVPQRPVKPKRLVLLFGAVFASLSASVGIVLAKEMISPAVRTEGELKAMAPTGVRLIGIIPRIDTPVDERRRLHFAVLASVACLLLLAAVAGVVLKVHPAL